MPKKMNMKMDECCGMHKRWKGFKMLILGLLVIANVQWSLVDWWMFAGIIIAFAGFLKLVMPMHKYK